MTHQNIPTSVKVKLESHVRRKFPLLTIASVVGMVPDRKEFREKLEFLHNNKYN